MKITPRREGSVDILDLEGRLTFGPPSEALRGEIKQRLEAGQTLFALDLTRVPYVDSTGLGELVACRESVRKRDGVIKLVASGKTYDICLITGMDCLFVIFHEEDKALASFDSENGPSGNP